jgi:hypothetical protein
MMGGSGKRQLADGSWTHSHTIGKLRRLRVPLPPLVFYLESGEFSEVKMYRYRLQ